MVEFVGKAFREKPIFSKDSGEGIDQYPKEGEDCVGEFIGCGNDGSYKIESK